MSPRQVVSELELKSLPDLITGLLLFLFLFCRLKNTPPDPHEESITQPFFVANWRTSCVKF